MRGVFGVSWLPKAVANPPPVAERCAGCLASRSFRLFLAAGDARVWRCENCGTCHIASPRKSQDNETEEYLGRAEASSVREREALDFFRWLRLSNPSGLHTLELGCSVGGFVKVGQQLGLTIEGVDIDERAVELGRARGLPLRLGTIDDCLGPYDLIFCNHVFEHIEAPDPFLAQIWERLNPGGAFAAVLPHVGLEARLKRGRWIGWSPSQHYWLYSPDGLGHLLERHGFNEIRIQVRNGVFADRLRDVWASPSTFARVLTRGAVRLASGLLGSGWLLFAAARRPNEGERLAP